jgi:hypothetical protein
MAYSSVTTPSIKTSLDIIDNRDTKPIHKELVYNMSFDEPMSSYPFMNMIRDMGGSILIQRCQISVPISYLMGNWKCVKKLLAKELKLLKEVP